LYKAYLVGDRVVVLNDEDARSIYAMGYFGHPLNVEKPKSPDDVKAPLALSPLEALYLVEKDILEVYDMAENKKYTFEELKVVWSLIEGLEERYVVYKEFREKGFIVRSGLKYGSDFTIYEFGPGIDHAPYVVEVRLKNEEIDPADIIKGGRMAHGVRKRYILALVEEEKAEYVMLKWYLP